MASSKPKIKKSQGALARSFSTFFRRFHLLIFFVLLVGCLAAAIILINKTLTDTPNDAYTSSINAGTIDETTLKRVQALHSSESPSPAPELPQGRVNPFAE
jgi:hypothetical protein